jgi:hypothetical protein
MRRWPQIRAGHGPSAYLRLVCIPSSMAKLHVELREGTCLQTGLLLGLFGGEDELKSFELLHRSVFCP